MEMKREYGINLRGEFSGIYEWGTGFLTRDIMQKWNWWWRVEFPKKRYGFWKYADGDDFGGCGHLSAIGGSIYMHPMNFNATLLSTGGCRCISLVDGQEYFVHFGSEVRELKKICDECAEFCGGEFSLTISPEFRLEIPEAELEYEKLDNYAKECGIPREENEYIY